MTLPKLSSLTPEQIRVMIAEACGFTRIYGCQSIITQVWVIAGGDRSRIHDCRTLETLPDYLSDLNAMHEAEKVLKWEQRKQYHSALADVAEFSYCEADTQEETELDWNCRICHATATQRAHAFLLATGKAQP